jgi:hypothetical protein
MNTQPLSTIAMTETVHGRFFEADFPLRLVITITKGDIKGEALQRLSQGTVIVYKTLADAEKAQAKFHAYAQCVQGGKFSSYGMSCIINEQTGEVLYPMHIS